MVKALALVLLVGCGLPTAEPEAFKADGGTEDKASQQTQSDAGTPGPEYVDVTMRYMWAQQTGYGNCPNNSWASGYCAKTVRMLKADWASKRSAYAGLCNVSDTGAICDNCAAQSIWCGSGYMDGYACSSVPNTGGSSCNWWP